MTRKNLQTFNQALAMFSPFAATAAAGGAPAPPRRRKENAPPLVRPRRSSRPALRDEAPARRHHREDLSALGSLRRVVRTCPCGCGSRRTPRPGSAPAMPSRGLDVRMFGAQERVGRQFQRDGRRHGRLALAAQRRRCARRDAFSTRIVGLDRQREARVRFRIFVAAIDDGLAGQRGELAERFPHHRERRLEHPPAAEREQRVAAERELVLLEPIDDMAGGVARRLDHLGLERADLDVVALDDRRVEPCDARGLLGGADDAHAGKRGAHGRECPGCGRRGGG